MFDQLKSVKDNINPELKLYKDYKDEVVGNWCPDIFSLNREYERLKAEDKKLGLQGVEYTYMPIQETILYTSGNSNPLASKDKRSGYQVVSSNRVKILRDRNIQMNKPENLV